LGNIRAGLSHGEKTTPAKKNQRAKARRYEIRKILIKNQSPAGVDFI
jgi:hypothetical protein